MELFAYLDPGSGSLIAATAAAGLAGVSVAAKSVWHRRTARFRKAGADSVVEATDDGVVAESTETAHDAD